MKYFVKVEFSKRVLCPEYGEYACNIDRFDVCFEYGKGKRFKSSKMAIDFINNRIDEVVLSMFNQVGIFVYRGSSGYGDWLKDDKSTMSTELIDRSFVNQLFA